MRRAITAKKGQAAIEFISTYGFAMVTLMLALGVINYFGFFNTASLRSQSCSLPRGLACSDFTLNTAAPPVATGSAQHLRMNVTNEFGVNITVTSITMTANLFPTTESCSANLPPSPWATGKSYIFWCPIPVGEYFSGEFYEGTVKIDFTQQGGTFVHSVSGRYAIKAQ